MWLLTSSQRPVAWAWPLALLLASVPVYTIPAYGQSQTPLMLADEQTEVRRVSFRFVDTQTFPDSRLKEQIATREPGFLDRIRRIVPLMEPPPYRLDPIELQRDVVRLRRFYNRQGFLNPSIDYPASQLDADRNTIHIVFTVEEGPPVIIESMDFLDDDGNPASTLFEGRMHDRWLRMRNQIGDHVGRRYSDGERVQIEDEILSWLQEHGYAFAVVNSFPEVDTLANTADIRFVLDPGPPARVGDIVIEGNEQVSHRAIERQLPFRTGDLYSNRRITRGQRDLFGLRLFRTVLVDLPPQPRDSLVTVRYRVREARPRYLSAETGYSREAGVELSGEWNHRNFFGGARHFTVGSTIRTGFLAVPPAGFGDLEPPRLFEVSASLRQPYLGIRGLSGVLRPFLELERDPLLEPSDELFEINRTQYGATTQAIFEFLPFRLLTARYTVSRTGQFTRQRASLGPIDPEFEVARERDQFNRSVLNLSGTFGQVDDFFDRTRGFLIQPFIETAGALMPTAIIQPGVDYYQLGGEASLYFPLAFQVDGGARLSVGRTWPIGASRDALFGDDGAERSRYRDRFRNVIFHIGGADDVRGWGRGLVGPQTIDRVEFARDEDGNILFDEGPEGELIPVTINNRFDPIGGLSKMVVNMETRMPFPGLGENWRLATFLDAGQVSSRIEDGQVVDRGALELRPDAFNFGTGLGIRYHTPVGYLRLDLAFKINPDPRDLQDPRDVFLWERREELREFGVEPQPPETQFLRRFNLHLSIGQAF